MSTYVITFPRGFDAPGGGTKSFLQIVHHLQKRGVRIITVPTSNRAGGGLSVSLINSLLTDASLEDFEVHSTAPSKIHYLLNGRSTANTIRHILEKNNVEAVISWEHEAAFLPGLLKQQGVPLTMIAAKPCYELEAKVERRGHPIKKQIDDWFRWRPFKLADLVFVSSSFTSNELVNLFDISSERIKITHRGIDPMFSQIDRHKIGKVHELIFYGSFSAIKGLPDVIKALGILHRQGVQQWRFKVAGWGDRQSIVDLVETEKLEDSVDFLGCLEPSELAKALSSAHLAVLPSRAESFGRSIAEAQAAGLPVIAYNIGSVPEIVDHEVTGWLVPPSRPDLLAKAILSALENPERAERMGIKGREKVTTLFSWEKTARIIDDSIQKLIAQKD